MDRTLPFSFIFMSETTTTPPTQPHSTDEMQCLIRSETLASFASKGVFVGKTPSGSMMAYQISMTPVGEISPEALSTGTTYTLLASSSHSRPMIEGRKNRIHHSLWQQGSVIRSMYIMDYVPWNLAMIPEIDDQGKLILRHRQLTDQERGVLGSNCPRYGAAYYEKNTINWRCLILASNFDCDAVGVIVKSTNGGKFVPSSVNNGGDRMTYSLLLIKFQKKKVDGVHRIVPIIKTIPGANMYESTNICSPVIRGALSYGPEPDGVFTDFEDCPGNYDLMKEKGKYITGTVEVDGNSEDPAYHPYVHLRADFTTLSPATAELPPVWGQQDLIKLFSL